MADVKIRGRVRSVEELRTRATDPDGDVIVTVNLLDRFVTTDQLSFVVPDGEQPEIGTEVEVTLTW